jgi:flagellar L-ring protein precursor FlgH
LRLEQSSDSKEADMSIKFNRRGFTGCCVAGGALLAARLAGAQDGSLLLSPVQGGPALTAAEGSYLHRELPIESRPRELMKHDIITVLVDWRTLMRSEGDAENRKTSTLLGVLSSWIRFDGKSIKAAPQNDGDPRVAGTYNSQYRAESDVELRDTLTFSIAAEILEIRPNGNLYIEADQEIENNEEHWRVFVSGEISRQAIQRDGTVSSKNIKGMRIVKREAGQVRDGYARGWLGKWYDAYKPF